jgi:hypothetical protein
MTSRSVHLEAGVRATRDLRRSTALDDLRQPGEPQSERLAAARSLLAPSERQVIGTRALGCVASRRAADSRHAEAAIRLARS